MKNLYKIVSFLMICILSIFLGIKLNQSFNNSVSWGDEYYGKSKAQIIEKFGEPKSIEVLKVKNAFEMELNKFYPFLEECNYKNVEILKFNRFFQKYEFWILNSNNENNVILVN